MLLIFTIMLCAAIFCSGSELEHFVDETRRYHDLHVDGTGMINMAFPQADFDTAILECAKRCLETRYYCQEFAIVGDSPTCHLSKGLLSVDPGPATDRIHRAYRLKNDIYSARLEEKSLFDRFTRDDVGELFHRYGMSPRRFHKTFLQVCKHAMSNGRLFTRDNLLTWRSKRPEVTLSDLKVSLSREIQKDLDGLTHYQTGRNWLTSYSKTVFSFLEIFSQSVSPDINTKHNIDRDLLILDTQRERIILGRLSSNLYGVLRQSQENPGTVDIYLPAPIPRTELQELLNFYKVEAEPRDTTPVCSVHYYMTDRNQIVSALRAITFVAGFLLDDEPVGIHLRNPEGVFYHDLVAAVVLRVLEREQSESRSFQTSISSRANKEQFSDVDVI